MDILIYMIKLCRKKSDYFNYGGGSEFFGHSLNTQETRIKKGLEKFKKRRNKY